MPKEKSKERRKKDRRAVANFTGRSQIDGTSGGEDKREFSTGRKCWMTLTVDLLSGKEGRGQKKPPRIGKGERRRFRSSGKPRERSGGRCHSSAF